MIRPAWISTPLAGTAAVFAVLALLAIPLHRLTSGSAAAALTTPAGDADDSTATPAVLYLRLLADADKVSITTPDGTPVWQLDPAPAGEHDIDATLTLAHHQTELTLTASFPQSANETAVFLTVEPDHLASQTQHAIGSGQITETLHFSWPE
ncbi:MAG: hypothetical protein Q7R22_012760 [Verrucomicrobiota bacterium JB025]|nr:hypothetical protein [Verrucomicrobiota bacterium JB025]